MRAVLDRSPEICRWVAAQIPQLHGRGFGEAQGIGIEDAHGRLLGGVVYHDWQPEQGTIQASFAAADPRWMLARDAWRQIFAYAWGGCGVHKIWSSTPRSNVRALKLVRGLGFTPEAILEKQFGSQEDAVISRLFKWERHPLLRDNAGHPNPARNVNQTKARRNGQTRSPEAA